MTLNSTIRILAGGDVCFDSDYQRRRRTAVRREYPKSLSRKLWMMLTRRLHRFFPGLKHQQHLNNLATARLHLTEEGIAEARSRTGLSSGGLTTDPDDPGNPFERILPLLMQKDLVTVNLETSLAGQEARVRGIFKSDPRYAQLMAKAGVSVVNLANNHMYDAGNVGMIQTMDALKHNGIAYTGCGANLKTARLGANKIINGKQIVILGYTQYCNGGFQSVAGDNSGILPLDTKLVIEDIKHARKYADFVFVHVHWGKEDQPHVQRETVQQAHLFIDSGADCILGHHPHVPHGIEVYNDRPIFYSLGNFVFPMYDPAWGDNFLTEVVIEDESILHIIIYPIGGKKDELFRPSLLKGERAIALLEDLQAKSDIFNTTITIENDLGYVSIRRA